MSFASFLSSPTIRIRIPPIASHPDAEEKLYTVHRSLLKAHTNLLSHGSVKPRETSMALSPTTSAAAFEAVLEFLYTGQYTMPEEYEFTTAEETKEKSPVVQAAMLGAIGVWGKPAAIHDDASASRNISSYQSELFPTLRNGYDAAHQQQQEQDVAVLPSPPPSPTFSTHEPVLSTKKKARVVVKHATTAAARLNMHLDVYALARRYGVRKLAELALENIKREVVAAPDILHELVRGVYGTKQKNEDLRTFVVGLVGEHWETLKREKVFEVLMKEGGDFVLDVFTKIRCF